MNTFEQRYVQHPDPWRFETSGYEQHRYDVTVAALLKQRYRSGFEPGCSIGVLTARLAERCDELLATDVSPTALTRAEELCAPFPGVRFELEDVSLHEPDGPFDLIVLSEIGYYFPQTQVVAMTTRLAATLEQGGQFLAVHWLGTSPDHVLHGDEVHETLLESLPLAHENSLREDGFRLDSWVRS